MNDIEDIRKLIVESLNEMGLNEEDIDEERISNKTAAKEVNARHNFVGSHTYGENIGDGEVGTDDGMYCAFSYNSLQPLYLWYKGIWYRNTSNYNNPDGTPNKWIERHRRQLRPNVETQGRPGQFLIKLINRFKKKHGIGDNSHTDLQPGEK